MFPRNSAFSHHVKNPLGRVELPKPGEQKVGETKRFGTVEIPIEELEAWNRELDDLVLVAHGYGRTASGALTQRITDVRDQIYRWLR